MPMKFPTFRSRREAAGPENMWTRCPSCEEQLFNKQLEKAMHVCPSCGHHFRLPATVRLSQLLDEGTWMERDGGLVSEDPLGFVDQKAYPDRVAAAQLSTGLRDAAVWGTGRIEGTPVAIVVMDFAFMGGSMGAVVGEKVARAAEAALDERIPLVIVSASGGARMQEGTFALMQLAKTMATLERLRLNDVPYISIMSDPTTGARVGAGTIGQELPPGFQRAEFLFQHGFVDRVVARPDLRHEVAQLLRYLVRPVEVIHG